MAAEHIDLLLTPATQDTAPPHRQITGDDFACTLPASLTGSPAAASRPAGTHPACHRRPARRAAVGGPPAARLPEAAGE
jgi:hypothetical protein